MFKLELIIHKQIINSPRGPCLLTDLTVYTANAKIGVLFLRLDDQLIDRIAHYLCFLRVVSISPLFSPSCASTGKETARKKWPLEILGVKGAKGKTSDKAREFDIFGQNNFSIDVNFSAY